MSYLYHLFTEYFTEGGMLMIPIFGVSLVAWFLGIEKMLFINRLIKTRQRYHSWLDAHSDAAELPTRPNFDNEAYDGLATNLVTYTTQRSSSCSIKLMFREFLITAVPHIDNGFSTMSAWISVAPLLGLLGTVGGMIETFRVITDFGLGNPNLTAQGISIALITTQAGLTVAFPMVLFHNYLLNRAKTIKHTLLQDGEELVNRFEPSARSQSGAMTHHV